MTTQKVSRKLDADTLPQRTPEGLQITPAWREALLEMDDGAPCVFLTGKAGTGKSSLLQYARSVLQQRIVVVAPTGIAAINVGGQTIHSFFRLPPRPITSDDVKRVRDRDLYRNIDLLVIDEISMVRADLLDGIDLFMRKNGRYRSRPFGGARVVMIGDLYQLPPVVARAEERQYLNAHYDTPYFFSAHVMATTGLKVTELTEVFRQPDPTFVNLLNGVRHGQLTPLQLRQLNARHRPGFVPPSDSSYITLTTTNRRAEVINTREMARIPRIERTYVAERTGEFARASAHNLPAPQALALKRGAQVMFVKNDPDRRWVNGTLGRVRKAEKGVIIVETEDGETVEVEPVRWEMQRYRFDGSAKTLTTEVVGTYTQMPLVLAWAVTIHKSQGKTFDRVVVDLTGRAFAHGQVYVALSRCRSLEGLVLTRRVHPRDLIVDTRVVRLGRP